MTVRPLGRHDLDQVSRLSQLAFGYRTEEPPELSSGMFGIDGADGRLLAFGRIRSYEQMWGGRRVPMGGIASVAVHPDGRGRGLASDLMRGLLPAMRETGQSLSVLFPTGVGLYRPTGWEVVGSLDDTVVETRDLQPSGDPGQVRVRTAGPADVEAVGELYAGFGATVNGLLTRDGPEFPAGPAGVLEHDVVALAETPDGGPLGYATYQRGTGYREASQLRVFECIARSGEATAALLQSIASWSTVASTVRWRGPTGGLALHLRRAVPPPTTVQPWMLRIVDATEAVSRRGFAEGVTADARFALADPDVPQHAGGWRLLVAAGRGLLEPVDDAGLAVLHIRGLALLYAGVADSAALVRLGLLDRPLPALDAAFAGQPPWILDYF